MSYFFGNIKENMSLSGIHWKNMGLSGNHLIVPDPQVPSNKVGTSPCSKQLLDFPCSDPYEKQCPE